MNQTPPPALLELSELDDLLAESVGKPKFPKGKPAAALTDLDDLLSESIAIRDEATANSSNREKLKRANLGREEREAIEAKVREWESRNVWTPVATVAVFERVTCSCEFYVDAFSHMMQEQRHKTQAATTRFIRTDEVVTGLPKKLVYQHAEVEICAECASSKGWEINELEIIEWQATAFK